MLCCVGQHDFNLCGCVVLCIVTSVLVAMLFYDGDFYIPSWLQYGSFSTITYLNVALNED